MPKPSWQNAPSHFIPEYQNASARRRETRAVGAEVFRLEFGRKKQGEKESKMARGSKAAYANEQKRQAEPIEKGYKKRGTSAREAARRAWATVNQETGGKKSGSGKKKKTARRVAARKRGRNAGRRSRTSASREAA